MCGSKILPSWKPPKSPFPVADFARNPRPLEDPTQNDGEGDEGSGGEEIVEEEETLPSITRHGNVAIKRTGNTVIIIYGETKWKGTIWATVGHFTQNKKNNF